MRRKSSLLVRAAVTRSIAEDLKQRGIEVNFRRALLEQCQAGAVRDLHGLEIPAVDRSRCSLESGIVHHASGTTADRLVRQTEGSACCTQHDWKLLDGAVFQFVSAIYPFNTRHFDPLPV